MIKTAVMGFGNPVRSDDAIGIYVVEQVKKVVGNNQNICIFDMGTAAFETLFQLKGHQKIILVDAVLHSKEPVGSIFKVPAHEVMRTPQEDPMVFLHSIKWDQALSYAKKILGKEYPRDIKVYLIAIENTCMEIELSSKVREAGDKVVQYILDELGIPSPKMITLKSSHLYIDSNLCELIFQNVTYVYVTYLSKEKHLLVAPTTNEWFSKVHKKPSQFLLKTRNKNGDKTIPIHEVLIDYEIASNDRVLDFTVVEDAKMIQITL